MNEQQQNSIYPSLKHHILHNDRISNNVQRNHIMNVKLIADCTIIIRNTISIYKEKRKTTTTTTTAAARLKFAYFRLSISGLCDASQSYELIARQTSSSNLLCYFYWKDRKCFLHILFWTIIGVLKQIAAICSCQYEIVNRKHSIIHHFVNTNYFISFFLHIWISFMMLNWTELIARSKYL